MERRNDQRKKDLPERHREQRKERRKERKIRKKDGLR
jgi:hypothetical protein